jgi:hypothetical protein
MSNPEETEYGKCPACGGRELISGYGMAFGRGIGSYLACNSCDWFQKGLDADLYTPEEIAAGGEPGPVCLHGKGSGHGGRDA